MKAYREGTYVCVRHGNHELMYIANIIISQYSKGVTISIYITGADPGAEYI